MCGIGGVLKITPPGEAHTPIPEEWLDDIDRAIAHRGPDGAGRFRDKVVRPDGSTVEVALVHRRLAIIDIETGHQPLIITKHDCPACAAKLRERAGDDAPKGVDPLLAVVFNGCIYNHRELRAELEAKGHTFKTDHSDTEVVAHAYAEWGDEVDIEEYETHDPHWNDPLVSRLDGMYAFGMWNRVAASLHLGRDAAGEKPLYSITSHDRQIARFSSRWIAENGFQTLTEIPVSPSPRLPEFDWEDVADGLCFGWTTAPDWPRHILTASVRSEEQVVVAEDRLGWFLVCAIVTLVTIALALLLASVVSARAAFGLWAILLLVIAFAASPLAGAVRRRFARRPDHKQLDSLLSSAVASRLESDVPLGCFLSGGIDSSLVAYYASQHVSDLTTLTVRMPDDRFDESQYAELVAKHLGTNHITLDCDGRTAADDLVHLITQLGLPFGDSSILPTYWLCREAREYVKVALSGDGADELFYGYDRYRAMRYLPPLIRHLAWLVPTGHLDRSDPKSRSDRIARLVTAARHNAYTDLLAIFPTPDRRELLGRKAGNLSGLGLVGGASAAREHDLGNYLPGDILRKTDTASMSVALEVRAPFLAREVTDLALAIPARVHMANGEGKHLLKDLARKHLPHEIIDRPKQGFAIPISEWLRTDFGNLRSLMMEKLNRPRPFGAAHDVLDFNLDFVQQMIDEHDAAGGLSPRHSIARPRDHGQRLFALTSLAIWADSLERR